MNAKNFNFIYVFNHSICKWYHDIAFFRDRSYSRSCMADLESSWIEMLDAAYLNAIESGRIDVADYLRLKLANDTIRQTGVNWLVQTLVEQAMEAERTYSHLKIHRIEPHSFRIGTSNLVGCKLEVQFGVRCLNLEAGWARTPSDGIMRNGALAFALISHFGMSAENAQYRLKRGPTFPVWVDEYEKNIDTDEISRHLELLLDRPNGFAR